MSKLEEYLVEDLKQSDVRAAYTRGMLESNLEQNRHLLVTSIASLILLTTVFKNSVDEFAPSVFWYFAVVSFATCVITTLLFFSQNTQYLRHILEKGSKTKNCCREHVDFLSKMSAISCICGIILLVSLMICNAKFSHKQDRYQFWRNHYSQTMNPYVVQMPNMTISAPQNEENCPMKNHHHKHHSKSHK